MKKFRCLIVDDEALSRLNLRAALADYPEWEVLAEAADADSARSLQQQHQADLIFLDIQMPGQSGLDCARQILQQSSAPEQVPLMVFVTAYSEHALQAFEVHALDYLLKPLDDDRLQDCLQRASTLLRQQQRANYAHALQDYLSQSETTSTPVYWQHLSIATPGRLERIQLSEVSHISAAGNYVELYLAGRQLLHRIAISKLASQLDPTTFLQIHRKHIVNVNFLQQLSWQAERQYEVLLRHGQRLSVSERYLDTLRQRLQQH